jgi:hypothetical protein
MRHPSFLAMAILFVSCIALAKALQQLELGQPQPAQSASAQTLEDTERTLVPPSTRPGSADAGLAGTGWHLRFQN